MTNGDMAATKLMMVYSKLHRLLIEFPHNRSFETVFPPNTREFILAMYQANIAQVYSCQYPWTKDRMKKANSIWNRARSYYDDNIIIAEQFDKVENRQYVPDC